MITKELDNMKPLDDDDDDAAAAAGGGMECAICSDVFEIQHVALCGAATTAHVICKPCLRQYITLSLKKGCVSSIPCPERECDALFATSDASAVLSEWDSIQIEQRERKRDVKVMLHASVKATLRCVCGAVGVVTDDAVGNGIVECPGPQCGKKYCVECGNDAHAGSSCPPPAETIEWLVKNSKKCKACPRCGERIEKNQG